MKGRSIRRSMTASPLVRLQSQDHERTVFTVYLGMRSPRQSSTSPKAVSSDRMFKRKRQTYSVNHRTAVVPGRMIYVNVWVSMPEQRLFGPRGASHGEPAAESIPSAHCSPVVTSTSSTCHPTSLRFVPPTSSASRAERMRLIDLLSLKIESKSQKRRALRKVLAKLDRAHDALTSKLQSDAFGISRKHLEIKLKANRRHRDKAHRLIADLDRRTAGNGARSSVTS